MAKSSTWLGVAFALLPPAHALTITIIRHGETEWNAAGRLQGSSDSSLTDLGVRQAEACGQRLSSGSNQFAALYCSPLPRARRTAELIFAGLEAGQCPPLREDARIRERSFGAWEGLVWSDIQRDYADELHISQDDPTYAISGGGESRLECLERVLAFLDELVLVHGPHESVLVVTHSAIATSIVKHVLGLRPEQRRSFGVQNLGLNEIECKPAADAGASPSWVLRTLNDCAHLDGLGSVDNVAV